MESRSKWPIGIFTGKVKDREGSFYQFAGNGQFTSPRGDTGVYSSNSTVIRGMGGMAGISGTSYDDSMFSPSMETSTYSGTMKFE